MEPIFKSIERLKTDDRNMFNPKNSYGIVRKSVDGNNLLYILEGCLTQEVRHVKYEVLINGTILDRFKRLIK